jgi:hypothetical protein
VGEEIDIFRLSGMKYPIQILASTFSTVSDVSENPGEKTKGGLIEGFAPPSGSPAVPESALGEADDNFW